MSYESDRIIEQAREALIYLSREDQHAVIAWAISYCEYPLPVEFVGAPDPIPSVEPAPEPEKRASPVDALSAEQQQRAAAIRLMAPVSDSDGGTMVFARYVVDGTVPDGE